MNTEKNKKIWIKKVHENLILRGRSENTYLNYNSALKRFFDYYPENTKIKKLKENDIIEFLMHEIISKNKCGSTLNVTVCAIRLCYSINFGIELNRNLLPTSKFTKKLPTILPKDDFLKIVRNAKFVKYQCWLLLAFYSGLRVDEVARIRIEDINAKEHKLKVLGKGNKERYTFLPDITIRALREYYKQSGMSKKSGYLFEGLAGKEHMNSKTIINYFSEIKRTYKLNKNISFHSLRHSFATYYLVNSGSLLKLQSMLGHKSLNTTAIYLHLALNFNELEGVKYV